jgi:transposase-like protein
MVMQRKKYGREFKLMAVELIEAQKRVKEVSEDLGVSKDLLYQWRRSL